MAEVKLKTHLIVSDVHEEYTIKWRKEIATIKPFLKNDLPIFILVGTRGRMELNTIDMALIERNAKNLSRPRGKESITSDCVSIYVLDEEENEKLVGRVLHDHVKQYQQMYDKFEYI